MSSTFYLRYLILYYLIDSFHSLLQIISDVLLFRTKLSHLLLFRRMAELPSCAATRRVVLRSSWPSDAAGRRFRVFT
jgi:hypothetical protein